jgi:hypothetical protein
MPINDLLAQHQLAQLNARNATSDEERSAFTDLESYYAARIAAWRAALELEPEGWPAPETAQKGR